MTNTTSSGGLAHDMTRMTAVSAAVGGTLWIAGCLARASLPRGCVADECLVRPMRGDSALGVTLFGLAALLIGLAGLGLLLTLRRSGGWARLGWAGLLSGAAGTVLLLVAWVAADVAGGDFVWMPFFVVPGFLLVAVGAGIVAVAVVRRRLVAWWAGAALAVGSGLLLAFNEQTEAVLLGIPAGVGWILVGVSLWPRAPASAPHPAPWSQVST